MKSDKYIHALNEVYHYLTLHYPNIINSNMTPRENIKFFITKCFVYLPKEINILMDNILQYEINQKQILDLEKQSNQLLVIKFDITQIKADAIVNAANSGGMGCFEYNHKCIDNIIHNKAGPRLRLDCKHVLAGSKLETSSAIITNAYNLPCKYVIHTVGPIYNKNEHNKCCFQLAECYDNCLKLAEQYKLKTIVFCCISTGLYGFPANDAANIAILTTKNYKHKNNTTLKVIFCTYTQNDFDIYANIMQKN
ncbi:hypothetical protein QJ857_gp0927 [Tupanvirus soda lake]|uniref:Macro domain-containing protein n=2 Tax=Tupanvirus TaxID=2094720 RepID=A0A6N1NKI1_9VIRU|nr:hypothetical protein QJ857_gp0927 [Tupanvirus soda lake]QKU35125.1 hypothetical protein [Tupanvirus soda lake]